MGVPVSNLLLKNNNSPNQAGFNLTYMKYFIPIFCTVCLILFASLSSCNEEGDTSSENSTVEETSNANSDPNGMAQDTLRKYKHNPWSGSFYGILPCDNCEGTEILITLDFDGRTHYSTREYASDDNGETGVGKAYWDETGKIVSVRDYYGTPHKFMYDFDKDVLYKLDENGNRYTGPKAASYTLIRSDD